jgi:hypothetical protein
MRIVRVTLPVLYGVIKGETPRDSKEKSGTGMVYLIQRRAAAERVLLRV